MKMRHWTVIWKMMMLIQIQLNSLIQIRCEETKEKKIKQNEKKMTSAVALSALLGVRINALSSQTQHNNNNNKFDNNKFNNNKFNNLH
jgi:Na+-translocating ferredoxin:NAD+ oxidoreductase RnfD subunit